MENITNLIDKIEKEDLNREDLIKIVENIKFSSPAKYQETTPKATNNLINSIENQISAIENTYNIPKQYYKSNKASEAASPVEVLHPMSSIKSKENSFTIEKFIQRGKMHSAKKEMELNKLIALKLEQEERACSFKPNINAEKCPCNPLPIVERLMQNDHIDRVALLQESKQIQEEEQLKKECTFHPKINPAPSYCKQNEHLSKNLANKTVVDQESNSCTFRPNIIGSKLNSKALESYLQQCAYDRLSAPKNASIEMLSKIEKEDQRKNLSTYQQNRRLSASNSGENDQFFHEGDFFQRQEKYENYKVEKIANVIENVSKAYEPRAYVNPKSEIILENALKKQNLPKPIEADNKEYTFHPKISLLGEKAKLKTYEEMSYEPMLLKEQKLSSLRSQLERNINDSLTFKPLLNVKFTNINSKVNFNDPDYVERIKYNNHEKEMKHTLIKESLTAKEMKECTHKPQITHYDPKRSNKKVARQKKESTYSKIHSSVRY